MWQRCFVERIRKHRYYGEKARICELLPNVFCIIPAMYSFLGTGFVAWIIEPGVGLWRYGSALVSR